MAYIPLQLVASFVKNGPRVGESSSNTDSVFLGCFL